MLVSVTCTKCEAVVADAPVGTNVSCPACGASLLIPMIEPGPGVTIGGYAIKELLGAGGMGKVFRAHQTSMGRDVVVKVLHPELTRDPEEIESFLSEIRMAARLEHPHIVRAYDAGEDGGHYYMAMAYVKGESLESRIAREGHLPEKKALGIVRKIGSALVYAWDTHRMLHRDVKPENILMDEQDEPKLADFGLARSLRESGGGDGDHIVGTPNYMSPEQMAGASDLDFRADMYSLGATLYRLLTGITPFDDSDLVRRMEFSADEFLPDPRKFNSRITAKCVSLLRVMLARDRAERHASWDALLNDIQRVSVDKALKTVVPSLEGSALRADMSGRPGAAAVRSGTQAAAIRATAGVPLAERSSSKKTTVVATAGVLLCLVLAGGAFGLLHVKQQRRLGRITAARAALQHDIAEVLQHAAERPADQAAALRRLDALRPRVLDPSDTERIETAKREVETICRAGAAAAWNELEQRVDEQVQLGLHGAALDLLVAYKGEFAEESKSRREERALVLKGEIAAAQAMREQKEREAAELKQEQAKSLAEHKLAALTGQIATALGELKLVEALRMAEGIKQDDALIPVAGDRDALCRQVSEVVLYKQAIADSFKEQVGQDVVVEVKGERRSVKIDAVNGLTVEARSSVRGAVVVTPFQVDDLSARERLLRLGSGESDERQIMRGLLALELNSAATATKYFGMSEAPLAKALLLGCAAATETKPVRPDTAEPVEPADAGAGRDYAEMLRGLGFTPQGKGGAADAAALARLDVSKMRASRAQSQLRSYLAKHAGSGFTQAHQPALALIMQFYSVPDQPANEDETVVVPPVSYEYGLLLGKPQGLHADPFDCAIDAGGNLLVVGAGEPAELQVFDSVSGALVRQQPLASGKPGRDSPYSMVVDSAGNLHVGLGKPSGGYGAILAYNGSGEQIGSTLLGGTLLPRSLARDAAGNYWVGPNDGSGPQLIEQGSGKLLAQLTGSNLQNAGFSRPSFRGGGMPAIELGADGWVYAADAARIIAFDPRDITRTVKVYLGDDGRRGVGSAPGEFDTTAPGSVGISSLRLAGGRLYVADDGNRRLQVFDLRGHFIQAFSYAGIQNYRNLAIDVAGNIYVLEKGAPGASRIHKFAVRLSAGP